MEFIKDLLEKEMNLNYIKNIGNVMQFEYGKGEKNYNYCQKCFDGVYLFLTDYKDISTYSTPTGFKMQSINISYCLDGQLQWKIPSTKEYAFLTKNTLVVDCQTKHADVSQFPMKKLKAIEFFIPMEQVSHKTKNLLMDFGISIDHIYEKFSKNAYCTINKDKKIIDLFSRFSGENFYDFNVYKLVFLEILYYLNDLKVSDDKFVYLPKAHIEKIYKVESLITKDFRVKYTIDELAQMVNMSKTYLNKAFKDIYGESIHSYLISKKVEYAKEKIKETDLKITDIAEYVGYANASKFSNVFKKVEGVSPRQYKEGIKYDL